MTTPVLQELRRKFPESEITFATDGPEAIGASKDVSAVIRTHEIRQDYDLTINLDGTYEERPLIHPVDAYAQACGVVCNDRQLIFTPQSKFSRSRPFIVFHGGPTGWNGRDWSLDKFSTVIRKAKQLGFETIGVEIESSKTLNDVDLNLAGRTTVDQLSAILKAASAFIGIDSFPAHLAQAVGCPSVVLFGTTIPDLRLTSPLAIGITSDAPCAGRHHREAPPIYRSFCDGECMKRIEPERVTESLDAILWKRHQS